ncbi:MAG: tetratricopeptide repeat protein [Alphaproteobacteria bacterium]|nr:tetratricopeptide repeat protein [Alphaproteobacteria bacterium]
MFVRDIANKAYQSGRDAMANGDYAMAQAAFRWARRADSRNPLYIHAEALLARKMGNPHEADRLFRRVLDLAERAYGPGHYQNSIFSANLIELYEQMGHTERAMKLREQVIAGLDRKTASFAGSRALDRLAEICLQAGRAADALSIYESALTCRIATFGDGHARVTECLVALTRLRARIRKLAEAAAARDMAAPPRPEIVWRQEERSSRAYSA